MSAELWRGPFGDAYGERNARAPDRWVFWRDLSNRYPYQSVLEIGCGAGHNLRFQVSGRLAGVDVNEAAIAVARLRVPRGEFMIAPASRVPLADRSFELVFTSGLLIHQSSHELPKVMDEVWRVSSRYLLAIEYYALHETEIMYRGRAGALWKRPYDQLFMDRFAVTELDRGFLARPGWDDCTWWLWEKRNGR